MCFQNLFKFKCQKKYQKHKKQKKNEFLHAKHI
jgi:hypothetical protein